MYKIVGADQREYGPVTGDELRQWIVEGRADAQTLVKAEGGAEWKPLGDFPEFIGDLEPEPEPPPSSPPPFSVPFAPVFGGSPEQTNGMATAGLVFGVLGFACCNCGPLFSIVGFICSCMALSQINSNPAQKGRGIAIAGLILSVLGGLVGFGLWSANIAGHHGRIWKFHW